MTEIIDTPPEVFISRRVVPGLVGTGLQRCAGVVEAMKPRQVTAERHPASGRVHSDSRQSARLSRFRVPVRRA